MYTGSCFEGAISHSFGLKVIRVSGGIKYALSGLKSSHPDLKAICMGTRRTDPHSGEEYVHACTCDIDHVMSCDDIS